MLYYSSKNVIMQKICSLVRKIMSESSNNFINKCVAQWKGDFSIDERLENFSEKFEDWIMQIPEESREIVKTLILNMDYYSRESANKWLEQLHKNLLEYDEITDDNTIYAFIKSKDGLSNSSNDYWTNYKAINRINSNLCVENLEAITEEQWGFINNIVFVDDFSGSGKSLVDELKKRPTTYSGKRVFFVALNIMQLAKDEISVFAKKYNINVIFIVSVIQKKAFERNLFSDDTVAKKAIETISSSFNIPSSHVLGFKNSESLVAFYNNTPNNTLGFIRYDTDNYYSIFPRRNEPKPIWQQFKKTKNRKIANYNNKVR